MPGTVGPPPLPFAQAESGKRQSLASSGYAARTGPAPNRRYRSAPLKSHFGNRDHGRRRAALRSCPVFPRFCSGGSWIETGCIRAVTLPLPAPMGLGIGLGDGRPRPLVPSPAAAPGPPAVPAQRASARANRAKTWSTSSAMTFSSRWHSCAQAVNANLTSGILQSPVLLR